jgi:hypothetical protein
MTVLTNGSHKRPWLPQLPPTSTLPPSPPQRHHRVTTLAPQPSRGAPPPSPNRLLLVPKPRPQPARLGMNEKSGPVIVGAGRGGGAKNGTTGCGFAAGTGTIGAALAAVGAVATAIAGAGGLGGGGVGALGGLGGGGRGGSSSLSPAMTAHLRASRTMKQHTEAWDIYMRKDENCMLPYAK